MNALEVSLCDLDVLYEVVAVCRCTSVVLRCRVIDEAEEIDKPIIDCFAW